MKRLSTCISAIFVFFVLTLCVLAQEKPVAAPSPKDANVKVPSVELIEDIEFPEVDGWTRGEKVTIPDEGGGTGMALNYDSKANGRVTIYIYTRGVKSIPNELTGVVKEELEGAKQAIQMVAASGVYGNVKEGKTETVTLGGDKGSVKALKAGFTFTRDKQVLVSDIILFARQNHFIKIRASRPGGADSDLAYAALLLALDQLFSKKI